MTHKYDPWALAMFGTGTRVDLDADVIKIGLLNIVTDYAAPDFTATSMTGITRYAGTTDQTLGSINILTTTAGSITAFDAADPTFSGVAASGGKTVGGFIIYKFVTNDAGSTPLYYVDGFTPVLPNGSDIIVQFDAGANRIVALGQ